MTESATLRARALVRLGQFETARRVLEAFRTKAERGTLRDDSIAMRCLFEFARIIELLGDGDGARNVYLAVVRLGIPNFLSGRNELVRGDAVFQVAEDEDRIVCAIRALAGAARLSEQPEAQSHIESARFMIDVAGPCLRGDSLAAAHLETELSSTVTGHLNQALRALRPPGSLMTAEVLRCATCTGRKLCFPRAHQRPTLRRSSLG